MEMEEDTQKEEQPKEQSTTENAINATASGPSASFEPLLKEFERLPKRQKQMSKSIGEQVDAILATLKKTKQILAAGATSEENNVLCCTSPYLPKGWRPDGHKSDCGGETR